MSSNQETARSTINTAGKTQLNSLATATAAAQSTIAASSSNVGYWCGKGGSGESTYEATVVSANLALNNSRVAAEMAKQSSVAQAKDTLRSQGEIL